MSEYVLYLTLLLLIWLACGLTWCTVKRSTWLHSKNLWRVPACFSVHLLISFILMDLMQSLWGVDDFSDVELRATNCRCWWGCRFVVSSCNFLCCVKAASRGGCGVAMENSRLFTSFLTPQVLNAPGLFWFSSQTWPSQILYASHGVNGLITALV